MTFFRKSHWETTRQSLAVGLCILALIFLGRKWLIASREYLTHGFIGYYAASRLWVEKKEGPQIYSHEWYFNYTKSFTNGQVAEVFGPNPPTMQLIALPSAYFSLPLARFLWTTKNLILMGLGLGFLAFSIRPRQGSWFYFLFAAFYLFFPPLIRNIELGQAYLIVLFFLALTYYGFQTQKAWLIGISLAMAFMLKSAGILLWVIPLFNRNWKALAWGIGTMLFLAFMTLPRIGLATWMAYPRAVFTATNNGTMAVTAYQSFPGLLSHLFQADALFNPTPLLNMPSLAKVLIFVLGLVSLGYTLYRMRGISIPLQVAALLTLNTIWVPLVEEHQLVLMLIPITILAGDLLTNVPSPQNSLLSLALFTAGVSLLYLPIPYKSQFLSIGWLSFFAYPRLYGNILLWSLSLLRMHPAQPIKQLLSPIYAQ